MSTPRPFHHCNLYSYLLAAVLHQPQYLVPQLHSYSSLVKMFCFLFVAFGWQIQRASTNPSHTIPCICIYRSVHTHYTCNSKRIGTLFLKLRSWYSQVPSPPRSELFARIPSTAVSGGMMWQTLTLTITRRSILLPDQKGPTGHGRARPSEAKRLPLRNYPRFSDSPRVGRTSHGFHPCILVSLYPPSARESE